MDFDIKQSKGRPHSWRPPIGAEALRCHAVNAIGHSWNRETAVSGLCWGCVEFLGCNGKRGKKKRLHVSSCNCADGQFGFGPRLQLRCSLPEKMC